MWDPKYQLYDFEGMARDSQRRIESFIVMAQDLCTDLCSRAMDQWVQQGQVQADLSNAWLEASREGLAELRKFTDTGLKMMGEWTWAAPATPATHKADPVKASTKPGPEKTELSKTKAPKSAKGEDEKAVAKSADKKTIVKAKSAPKAASKPRTKPAKKTAPPAKAAKAAAKPAAKKKAAKARTKPGDKTTPPATDKK